MTKTRMQPAPQPRHRHRIFPWIFLAVQLLFLAWVIMGGETGSDCSPDYQGACETGTAIGVGLIIALWVAVDIILALTYMVFKIFRR
ncbi:hypothetical protein [Actinomadura algeriensis]|uniref:Uncharacterized protein n=1 Tax=Actinomadura algeriensis TaxID=1679523 RepID=A0ABR9JTG4_9ACTN|nr:hypothetical protein [Actinomadura algeriensis]MBE1533684.1 hypothetical protein [Actinomadura algeriensis]